jgi:Icc-related predicted phosphoesterase
VIRVAAVGDVHVGADTDDRLRVGWEHVGRHADALLLAGDLTRCGTPEEAGNLIAALRDVDVPIVAVLGNHDHHAERADEVADVLAGAGVCVLEGSSVVLDLPAGRLGVAGVKGFGGGFAPAHATAFGEREMKSFVEHTERVASDLDRALDELDAVECDARIALLHYSPVPGTLVGEPLEIYPFLGSQLLAEVIDRHEPQLTLHGHAHAGSHEGRTLGGVPVRNVAMPVLGRAYCVFELS